MEIIELIDSKLMNLDLKSNTKWEVVRELTDLLIQEERIDSVEQFIEDVKKREEQVSTGVGFGIAIPHGISTAVKIPSIVFGRSEKGIDYESIDGRPVHLLFLFAIPDSFKEKDYLRALSSMARLLVHDSIRKNLLSAKSFKDVRLAIS